MEPKTFTLRLSVLLLHCEGMWVAQCLEHDLAAQGRSIAAAKDALARTIAGQVIVDVEHNQEPLATFSAAPAEYWAKFKKGER